PAAEAVACVAHTGPAGLVGSADLVRWAPILTYRMAPPAPSVVALYYVALCASWTLGRRRREIVGSAESAPAKAIRHGATSVAVAAAVWMLAEPWALVTARGDGRLHAT